MAITTRFYLDTRAARGEAPLKLAIHKRHEGAMLGTGVRLLPSQWDARAQRVINHPQKAALNSFLAGFKFRADTFIRDLVLDGSAAPMIARQLKDWLDERLHGERTPATFVEFYRRASDQEGLSAHTRIAYRSALSSFRNYDPHIESRPLASITSKWVADYIAYLEGQGASANTQASYLACLRKALGLARKAGKIHTDPTEAVKVRSTPSRHRDLSAEQMRLMLNAPTEGRAERTALDFFAFSFYCRAANAADIFSLTPANIDNGRIYYVRAKTSKPYSVRIEPELQALIDARSDGTRLFPTSAASVDSFIKVVNRSLRSRAERLGLPPVTTYWARHTFASIAFSLDYGMDIVSASLGHSLGGARVTSTYVSIKDRQVDDLARAVYDAVQKSPSVQSENTSDAGNSVPDKGSSTK